MVASRWFCRSCMGFVPRVYDVNIVIAIATVWCLHLQRSSHKNKQIHISRRTYDDLVKDVRVCVLLCDRIFVYLPFTDRLYPIIMVLLYGIIYSNFPKAKSHFSHIRIIIIVVVVAVTFTPPNHWLFHLSCVFRLLLSLISDNSALWHTFATT